MIQKLRKRFIRIAVLVLTLAMVLVLGIVNMANLISVRNELSGTLSVLAENMIPTRGASGMPEGPKEPDVPALPELPAPEAPEAQEESEEGDVEIVDMEEAGRAFAWMRERSRHFRNMVIESSWFIVRFDTEGEVRMRNVSNLADTDQDTFEALARKALESGNESGWIRDYCFTVRDEGEWGKAVVVMNCETRMEAVRKLMLISAIACAGGILMAWLLVRLFSWKAIEPTIRNMEQQKRFITDASHELKTPLTVISTNMELLKMETPDNPWVRSTQKQTAAMRRLVDELVYLSRMEEEHPALTMETLNPGAMLRETAEPFQAMAEFGGKEMNVAADDSLRITGDRASLQRLMSTLLDNAVKYAPEGGEIFAEVSPEGKSVVIRVSNTVEKPLTKEQCAQLFNRFYRADASRNKDKQSGFGIGLSIAAAIAEKHGGTMDARMEEEKLVITARLPRDHKPDLPLMTA